jgi:periplasmic divalent cation tolerance protein
MDVDATVFATTLVGERLAACVTVRAPVESVYRWKGAIERDCEQQVLIKTTADRVPALAARVREIHPYELPELLVTRIEDGNDAYLAWVRESTATHLL